MSFFITPGLNQRVYVDTVNAAGQQRNSTGWNIGVGASVALGPKSSLEGSVGLTSQTYTATGTTTSATTFSLAGTWNGYEPLILRPVLMRTINKLALSNYQNYVSTVAGIDFTYDIHYPWKAVGGISYNTADYTPTPGVAGVNPRTDYFRESLVGLALRGPSAVLDRPAVRIFHRLIDRCRGRRAAIQPQLFLHSLGCQTVMS